MVIAARSNTQQSFVKYCFNLAWITFKWTSLSLCDFQFWFTRMFVLLNLYRSFGIFDLLMLKTKQKFSKLCTWASVSLISTFPLYFPGGAVGQIFSTMAVLRSSWQSGTWSPSAGPCWPTASSTTVEMTKSKASCGTWSPPQRMDAPRSCRITWVSLKAPSIYFNDNR